MYAFDSQSRQFSIFFWKSAQQEKEYKNSMTGYYSLRLGKRGDWSILLVRNKIFLMIENGMKEHN